MLFSASMVNVVIVFLLCQQWFAAGPFIALFRDTSKSFLFANVLNLQGLAGAVASWEQVAAVAGGSKHVATKSKNVTPPVAIFYKSRFDPNPDLPLRISRYIWEVAIMFPVPQPSAETGFREAGIGILRMGPLCTPCRAILEEGQRPPGASLFHFGAGFANRNHLSD